ncbi:MAG: hypothetical protein GY866_31840 [Proteobacteria bacterium]|nr:hypothetical protein [Pseudomonadota bacterium]
MYDPLVTMQQYSCFSIGKCLATVLEDINHKGHEEVRSVSKEDFLIFVSFVVIILTDKQRF